MLTIFSYALFSFYGEYKNQNELFIFLIGLLLGVGGPFVSVFVSEFESRLLELCRSLQFLKLVSLLCVLPVGEIHFNLGWNDY